MQNKYMQPRGQRREARTYAGKFRGGKLVPVNAVGFRESESGALTQSVHFELEPVAGKIITPVIAEVIAIFVPAQAIEALKNPNDPYTGSAEVMREKLLSGAPLFDVEPENEITQRCGVVPRSIAGVKMVSEAVRLAHNAAINYLRTRKYVNATKLDANSTAITPALIGQTVLDRLNAVLDPEDRVNGKVNFSIPNVKLPIDGLGMFNVGGNGPYVPGTNIKESDGSVHHSSEGYAGTNADVFIKTAAGVDPNNPTWEFPQVFAEGELTTSEMSIQDFYIAEFKDRLTREMREMVDKNPEFGEELATRYAHGLSADVGKQPFVVYRREVQFGKHLQTATDGASLGTEQTNMETGINFTAPIPATEFGGIVITFASVKPDETLASQPHPVLSDVWAARNYVADEIALDPVPVTIRDLNADCAAGDEGTVVCYNGNNHLLKSYINYGFTRDTDVTTVENKTAIWQLEVPMSVTPESVLYPEDLDHYPFLLNAPTDDACTYTVNTMARINTPVIFGPTPVEELAQIETDDIFEDA